MNGLGNEILVLDLRRVARGLTTADVQALARQPGLGFEQLMVLQPAQSALSDARVAIYNNDGSSSGACGNGMRCIAWAEHQHECRHEHDRGAEAHNTADGAGHEAQSEYCEEFHAAIVAAGIYCPSVDSAFKE